MFGCQVKLVTFSANILKDDEVISRCTLYTLHMHAILFIPVQLTPAMVPLEHCELLGRHSCILPSVPLQFTPKSCEDDTAMLSGTPSADSSG